MAMYHMRGCIVVGDMRYIINGFFLENGDKLAGNEIETDGENVGAYTLVGNEKIEDGKIKLHLHLVGEDGFKEDINVEKKGDGIEGRYSGDCNFMGYKDDNFPVDLVVEAASC